MRECECESMRVSVRVCVSVVKTAHSRNCTLSHSLRPHSPASFPCPYARVPKVTNNVTGCACPFPCANHWACRSLSNKLSFGHLHWLLPPSFASCCLPCHAHHPASALAVALTLSLQGNNSVQGLDKPILSLFFSLSPSLNLSLFTPNLLTFGAAKQVATLHPSVLPSHICVSFFFYCR